MNLLYEIFASELRRRCVEVGYKEIHVGRRDVMALFDGQEPRINERVALWEIVDEIASMSCGTGNPGVHHACFDTHKLSAVQLKALSFAPYNWAYEQIR